MNACFMAGPTVPGASKGFFRPEASRPGGVVSSRET